MVVISGENIHITVKNGDKTEGAGVIISVVMVTMVVVTVKATGGCV